MNTPHASAQPLYDTLTDAARRFVNDVVAKLPAGQHLGSTEIFKSLLAGVHHDHEKWAAMQQEFYRKHLQLWMSFSQSPAPVAAQPPLIEPARGDRRFAAPEWQQLPYFDYLKQLYLLNSQWLTQLIEEAKLDVPTKNKLRFFTRQLIDASSPANFPATNPEVIKLAAESEGENLRRGLELLEEDLKKGRISMTDESAFEIGRNIAVTPGKVVFENELIQLIQYDPLTAKVYSRPLLMVPPCINKFYILDLQPENSFVRYAVSEGHTVFMVSWRNVTDDMGHFTWDDYVGNGILAAIKAARDICGVRTINVLGFCVGGTLVGSALAVLAAKRQKLAASLTLLAAMLDFSDTGELSVFIDNAYVEQRERDAARGGLLRGRELALTFSSLRANDLIWNYVVNNYLKGRKPHAFDLLYWNSDSTNLPGAMFAYYVRNTYLENNLRIPGKLSMCGVPVDLAQISIPAYIMAAREDHIVPWRTAYQSTTLLGGDKRFVLAASGHIAGVVNPAAQNRRSHWINDASATGAEDWFAGAQSRPGSWWSDWSQWLAGYGGKKVSARLPGSHERYPAIEPAPGRYVKQPMA